VRQIVRQQTTALYPRVADRAGFQFLLEQPHDALPPIFDF
jgi:hypothetical protein